MLADDWLAAWQQALRERAAEGRREPRVSVGDLRCA
jgi:hypothetical protein